MNEARTITVKTKKLSIETLLQPSDEKEIDPVKIPKRFRDTVIERATCDKDRITRTNDHQPS